MTRLDRLIEAHVEHATVETVSNATERVAEEMARQILKDEAFWAEMRAIIRANFGSTLQRLTSDRNGGRKRGRKRRQATPRNRNDR